MVTQVFSSLVFHEILGLACQVGRWQKEHRNWNSFLLWQWIAEQKQIQLRSKGMALMSSCRYYPQEVFWQSKWSVLSEWISAQLCSVSVFSVLQILVQYAKAVFLCCTNVFSICVLQYAQAVLLLSQVEVSLLCNSSVFPSQRVVGVCLERFCSTLLYFRQCFSLKWISLLCNSGVFPS